jgi:hypothetical protein
MALIKGKFKLEHKTAASAALAASRRALGPGWATSRNKPIQKLTCSAGIKA